REVVEGDQGEPARRRHNLRPTRYDHGAQPHRLRAPQQNHVPSGGDGRPARRGERARRRPLRRDQPGRCGTRHHAHDAAAPGRLRRTSRPHLEGTHRAGRAHRRRRVARDRELGVPRTRTSGRVRHRSAERVAIRADHRSIHSPFPRIGAGRDRRTRTRPAVDAARDRKGRQLQGYLRSQSRTRDAAQDRSRTQQTVDGRRPALLAAVSVMRPPSLRRDAVLQGLGLGLTAAVVWWLARNTGASLAQRGLTLGFGFLRHPANFEIGDTWWLRFSPADSVGRAIVVGLLNTALVSALGCVLAIAVGFVAGILRLSPNPALRGLVRAAVEIVRNTPLLLLLLFLAASLHALPPPKQALSPVHGVFLSDRGLVLPAVSVSRWTILFVVAAVGALVLRRPLGRWWWVAPAAFAAAALVSAVVRPPVTTVARLRGFN